jgi:hypothetical protein
VPNLSAPPWTEPLPAIDYGRILVVDNSDLAWCRPRNLEYAAIYNIPAANVLSLPFGTNLGGYQPASDAVFLSTVVRPLQAKMDELQPSMVIFGAGVPARCVFYIREGGPAPIPFNVSATTLGTAGLWLALMEARRIRGLEAITSGSAFAQATGTAVLEELLTINGQTYFTIPYQAPTPLGDVLAGDPNNTTGAFREYSLRGGIVTIKVPTVAGLESAMSGNRPDMPFGKFGWGDIWQRGPYEDDAVIGQLLDRIRVAKNLGQPYGPQQDPFPPRKRPILMSLRGSAESTVDDDCAWCLLMKDWGLDVKYYYHNSAPNPPYDTLLPESGAVCTWAQWQAGLSPIQSVSWHLGCCENDEIFQSPRLAMENNLAYRAGSHSTVVAQSTGNEWNVRAISERTAIAGTTDIAHRNGTQVWNDFSIWHGLLRGLPYILATHCRQLAGNGTGVAIGDPLWAPFYVPEKRKPVLRYGPRRGPA